MALPNLSLEEKKQLRFQIEREIYTRSLYEFFKAAAEIMYPQTQWSWNWHFKYICDILQSETERIIRKEEKTQDIIINLPFRSGKSILISQIYPVWCWLKDASLAIMQVSHSELLAVKHSHASKMLIESTWFMERFPNLTLRVDTNAKNNYMTNSGGKRISFGISSSIIGEGCNIQICDDLNSPTDSQAGNTAINEIYSDTLYSRLNNPEVDIRIILQQRVSETDICGYLLKKNPDKYFHICIPARLTPQVSPVDLSMYYQDGLFWKSRFSDKVLLDFKDTLGSRAYSGQLMQLPQSLEGTIIKRNWFPIITQQQFQALIKDTKPVFNLFLDSAYTAKQTNDASALILATKIGNSMYILKAWKFYLEFPQLILQLKTIQKQFGCRLIYVETKASGISIIQQLKNDGFDTKELKADGDKIARANGVTPAMEGGRVNIVEDISNEMLLQELAAFPTGAHDDLVDATVYGIITLLNSTAFNFQMM